VTPNVAHARCALAAARRGLHVLVEKPMALTEEECGLMIAAAHETGVMCAVLHCMNWSPALAAARASLSSGAIPLPSSLPCQATKAASNPPPAGAIGSVTSAVFTASFDAGLEEFNIHVSQCR
jgi:predicted dehydrogenase